MKINQIQQTLPYGEGYETIGEYKLYTDKKAPYWSTPSMKMSR